MKRLLTVGINFASTDAELRGCVNDARNVAAAHRDLGWEARTILEESATKANILAEVERLATDSKPGDDIRIHYSSHGTWVPDADGDEIDGRDEALCPYDVFDTGAVITDDEIYEALSVRRAGVRCLLFFDTCHSGTANRWMPSTFTTARVKFLPPRTFSDDVPADTVHVARRRLKTPVPIISGCQAHEFSYDAEIGGTFQGAFTAALLPALAKATPETTLRQLHASVRESLPTAQYPQTPVLTATSGQRRWRVA